MTRCILAALLISAAPLLFLDACGREAAPEVVLYSSVDDYLLRDAVAEFERQSGIKVLVVGDTEATKTTGLVQRLIAERAHPRGDVWWSSEAFGTMKLAEEGLLEPYVSSAAEADVGGWPERMRSADGMWYAFASRARVVVFNTGRVNAEEAPRRLADLADPKWKGRLGMARPQFGTTKGQMAALGAAWGEEGLRSWLTAMKANRVRLYDGNASVVRGVAHGEIDVGLTDTDDVWAGQREGFPVELAFENVEEPGSSRWWSFGPLPMPNTVAIVKDGPNPEQARTLIDFILSERVERMLAASDSHNTPVRPELAEEFVQWAIPPGRAPSLAEMQAAMGAAMRVCDEVLGN